MWFRLVPLGALVLASCSLVKGTGIQTDYSFDAIEYASPNFGDPTTTDTVPDLDCDPANDTCAAMTGYGTQGATAAITAACDATFHKCVAQAEIRVSETIDLTKQVDSSFPSAAIQYGVEAVDVKRVTYWIGQNQLNVATPQIDFYVAPMSARTENDAGAVPLASVAKVAAMSTACGDPAYVDGDAKADGAPVCSAPLPQAGKDALAAFVKDYKTPFQIIAHSVLSAQPGEPVPAGSISFAARPTVGLKILD